MRARTVSREIPLLVSLSPRSRPQLLQRPRSLDTRRLRLLFRPRPIEVRCRSDGEFERKGRCGRARALFADGYLGAPVFSNVPSRPDCKSHSCDRQNCSQHCDPFPVGKKSVIQDAETRILRIEQNKPAHHESNMKQARERRLSLLDAFLITRSPDPVDAKRNPCRLND